MCLFAGKKYDVIQIYVVSPKVDFVRFDIQIRMYIKIGASRNTISAPMSGSIYPGVTAAQHYEHLHTHTHTYSRLAADGCKYVLG